MPTLHIPSSTGRPTTEKRAARTLLEDSTSITIGGRTYAVAPPTLATLIRCSELIAELPMLVLPVPANDQPEVSSGRADGSDDLYATGDTTQSAPNLLVQSLAQARYAYPIARIIATLVMGERRYTSTEGLLERWYSFRHRRRTQLLTCRIADTMTPKELFALLYRLLQGLEVQDFFGITTFLHEINMLQRTVDKRAARIS